MGVWNATNIMSMRIKGRKSVVFFCLLSNNLLTPAFKLGIGMCQMFWASALIESGINGKPIMAKTVFYL